MFSLLLLQMHFLLLAHNLLNFLLLISQSSSVRISLVSQPTRAPVCGSRAMAQDHRESRRLWGPLLALQLQSSPHVHPPRLTPPTHSFTPQFSIINFYVGLIKLILEMVGLEEVYCGIMIGKFLAIQTSFLLAQLVQICGHLSCDCTQSYSTNVYYIFRP